jgi:small subunit ribosomal protein S15
MVIKGKDMLDKKKKLKLIEKFKTHKNDTGSPEVQIAILTEEVKELTRHLKENKKDFSSRRGLIAKVSLRHKLLRYLEREDEKRFSKLLNTLGLKFNKKEKNDALKDAIVLGTPEEGPDEEEKDKE